MKPDKYVNQTQDAGEIELNWFLKQNTKIFSKYIRVKILFLCFL